jgi:hypothetical protein
LSGAPACPGVDFKRAARLTPEAIMSSEVHLIRFHNGEPSSFPPSLIEQSFAPYITVWREGCWGLKYPDGWDGEIYASSKGDQTYGVSVYRPPASPEFWKSLFDLMKATSGCVFWPSGGCVIADPAVREHVDLELIEALGEPRLVTAPMQMLDR